MRTRKFASEIYWPLKLWILTKIQNWVWKIQKILILRLQMLWLTNGAHSLDRFLQFLPNLVSVFWDKKLVLFHKVHIFWEGHKILRNLHLAFVPCKYLVQDQSKVRWRFRKILLPSQNIWTLSKAMKFVDKIQNWVTYWLKRKCSI